MANDKCPKCGAEIDEPKINRTPYRCRSVKWADDEFDQSDFCRTRCELASLRTKHQRLVEAARRITGKAVKITGGMGEFVGWEIDGDEMTGLKQALESEANND